MNTSYNNNNNNKNKTQQNQNQMQQQQHLRGSMSNEKDEELALFLEMKKQEQEFLNFSEHEPQGLDSPPLGSKTGTSPIFNISLSDVPSRKIGSDDFLNSEGDKNDYEWLLTPPGTPLFPSLEMESHTTVMRRPTALKSRLTNPQPDHPVRGKLASKQVPASPGSNSSSAGLRRPASSGGPGSRPGTPNGYCKSTSGAKPSRSATPTSRTTLPLLKPTVSATRVTASITKPATASLKPSVPTRSSTPTRSAPRSSTPTTRPSTPPSKSTSRAATPTRRPSTPSSVPNMSAPRSKPSPSITPNKLSPAVSKPAPTTARNTVPSRGISSPIMKSRPWKPSEMPGYSLDTPPNLRTTLPERPLSATRGRPGVPSPRSSSVDPAPTGRPRRQSCSPSRGRAPNGISHTSGSSVPAFRHGHSKVNDNVSPVVIGTKMVERVINMRKLAPPKHDDKHSAMSRKSSSPDSSGFGRTLSKKSLDMAIRHMDIRRTIPSNLRPLMTNIPASSMYSVRTGPPRSRTISVSDSPIATSSNASSEVSVNNNDGYIDGTELDDEIVSRRTGRSPLRGR